VFERYEIRLSGAGGQGMILGGVILAEAAAIHDNLYAVQSQSYGPEARGGASKSEVIIGTEPISYPKAVNPDLLLAMNQESFDKYAPSVKKGGIIIIDSDFATDNLHGDYTLIELPITDLAINKVGRPMVVNIIALGIIQAISNIVTYDSLKKAVLNRVPKGTEEMNTRALDTGVEAAKNFKKEHSL